MPDPDTCFRVSEAGVRAAAIELYDAGGDHLARVRRAIVAYLAAAASEEDAT
jgi:hypothetical protein